MIANPFDINKAVDYTDEDIFKYWVNIKPTGFNEMIKPNTLMPMIIVGSKGSGKTHIMKYYSYEIQKIRVRETHATKPIDGFNEESFVGIYVRCSGLNANVFAGKGVDDQIWETLFSYYWELWIGERMLSTLTDMMETGIIRADEEGGLVKGIMKLFMKHDKDCKTLVDVRDYLLELQKSLLFEIHNFLFLSRQSPIVEIKLNVSAMTFGIPNVLQKTVDYFKERRILYLIDEYENFSEKQQEVMMTLLREKPTSCTIRIGTRPYGIRTYYTIGKIEENRAGSEFDFLYLDDVIRDAENYKQYLEDICVKRLQGAGLVLTETFCLNDHIERMEPQQVLEKAAKMKSTGKIKDKLRKNLEVYRSQKLTDEMIDTIVDCVTNDDLVVERACIALLYKKIKAKSKNLVEDAQKIKDEARRYTSKDNLEENDIAGYLDYYKKDILDAIAKDAHIPIPYYGLDTLIALSCGTPRTLLRLLKYSFSKQYFNTGKVPFEKGRKLSVESQQAGIESTYDWFFEENRIPNDEARVADVVERLGGYLQNARFSQLPPQCSIDIFSVQKESLSAEAQRSLHLLTLYSYIVSHKDRRKKNAENKSSTYKLNTILIPRWELALESRGNVELSTSDAEMIFNPAFADHYKSFVKNKMKAYNFPFHNSQQRQDAAYPGQPSLFDF